MKAIFSKLKTRDSTSEDDNGKRHTGSQPVRRIAHGFNSLSRATGGKTPHQRQTSDSYPITEQQPASANRQIRRPFLRLSLGPRAASQTERSSSTSTYASRSQLESPTGLGVASSTELVRDEQPTTLEGQGVGSRTISRPQSDYSKPLPARPSTDTNDTFGGSQSNGKTGRSFGYWGNKKSEKQVSSSRTSFKGQQSASTAFLHRRSSRDSTQSTGVESRPSSVAMSPSSDSQRSLASEEEKEYCKSRQSWTGMTEVDLVANLSVQERTRQEVLYEIVSSEERYVLDLIKMKETFIDMLIPPETTDSPCVLSNSLLPTQSRQSNSSASLSSQRMNHPIPHGSRSVSQSSAYHENVEILPIAAQFATNRSVPSVHDLFFPEDGDRDTSSGNQRLEIGDSYGSPPRRRGEAQMGEVDADATVRIKRTYHLHTREQSEEKKGEVDATVPSDDQASPPARRLPDRELNPTLHSYGSLAHRQPSRQSRRSLYHSPPNSPLTGTSRLASSIRKRISSVTSSSDLDHHQAMLPEDLRIVLQVIGDALLKGHVALSDALRKRYDEQYPLVRSLADIFIEHSYLFQEYTAYVVHLEKALQQLDDCLVAASANKRRYSGLSTHNETAVGKMLQSLNETANDKGETGLAIALSKPFQRLLKYPLLFQNLLFNTDATLSEYDSCMNLLEEVDSIVRSMEDEKASKDDSEKTRDALARIEGLDRDSTLYLPRPSRLFVGEHPVSDGEGHAAAMYNHPHRRSLRRLSDLMQGHGQPTLETWEVMFSDVTLVCQKVGTTTLPIYSRTQTVTDEGRTPARRKSMRLGRRSRHIEQRNLYQFLSVKEWHSKEQPSKEQNGFTNLQRQQSTSGSSSISHHDSIKEEDSDEAESSSDDSEQMKFILGEASSRRRISVIPLEANIVDQPAKTTQTLPTPTSPSKLPTAPGRTSRISSRIASKSSTGALPERARPPTEMLNSQAKFGTRLRNPEISTSASNGRVSSANLVVRPPQVETGSQPPSRMSQRAVSTPVFSTRRDSTRLPPSSVRGTAKRF